MHATRHVPKERADSARDGVALSGSQACPAPIESHGSVSTLPDQAPNVGFQVLGESSQEDCDLANVLVTAGVRFTCKPSYCNAFYFKRSFWKKKRDLIIWSYPAILRRSLHITATSHAHRELAEQHGQLFLGM